MTCEFAIYELLDDIALFSGRVYALRAPQNAVAPFVVFQRIDVDNWRSLTAPSGIKQATVQIDIYAENYKASRTAAKSVEDALDGFRGMVNISGTSPPLPSVRIAGITMQGDQDLLDQTDEPFLYRVSADYLVTFEQ
jgi:hypothetical protein